MFPFIQPGAAAGLFVRSVIKHAKVGIGQQADFIRADGILCVVAKMASFCPSDLKAFELRKTVQVTDVTD